MRKLWIAIFLTVVIIPAAASTADSSKSPLYHFVLEDTFTLNDVCLDAGEYLIRLNGNEAEVFSGDRKVASFPAKFKGVKRGFEPPFQGRVELIRINQDEEIEAFRVASGQILVGKGTLQGSIE